MDLLTRAVDVVSLSGSQLVRDTREECEMFERFEFTDDGQWFRVVVVKLGRVRIASYSNRLGLSVWRVR